MTHEEAVALCRYVKAACPQQAFDTFTPDAWADLLGDLDVGEAKDAARTVAQGKPFVSPSEIRAEVRRVRDLRASRAIAPAPPAELAEIPDQYAEFVREGVARLAAGWTSWNNRRPGSPPSAEYLAETRSMYPELIGVGADASDDAEAAEQLARLREAKMREKAAQQVAEARRGRAEPVARSTVEAADDQEADATA